LASERGRHDGARGDPGAGTDADLAGENDHRYDDQQQIRRDVVHRQADCGNRKGKSGSLAPTRPGRRSTFTRRNHHAATSCSVQSSVRSLPKSALA
jgi:hypothetical protein